MTDPSPKNKKISDNRKQTFQVGTVLMAIGMVLFLSVFLMTFSGGGLGRGNFGIAFVGVVAVAIGQFMRKVGRKGLAGSGVILDMEKEKKDMEPINRMRGGQINDTLEEVDLKSHLGRSEKQIIKIRCTKCKHLNDEEDKFCGGCGSAI
jgi:hypothetical protein